MSYQGSRRGIVTLLHLDDLDPPPSAAETAYVLGNDPELIRYAIEDDREQEGAWSESAVAEQLALDLELAQVNLGEARAAAMSMQRKREALRYVLAHEPPQVDFAFSSELADVQRLELHWLKIHSECTRAWNRTETCPVHGAAITAGVAAQREAVLRLRDRLKVLVAEQLRRT